MFGLAHLLLEGLAYQPTYDSPGASGVEEVGMEPVAAFSFFYFSPCCSFPCRGLDAKRVEGCCFETYVPRHEKGLFGRKSQVDLLEGNVYRINYKRIMRLS